MIEKIAGCDKKYWSKGIKDVIIGGDKLAVVDSDDELAVNSRDITENMHNWWELWWQWMKL